MALSAPGYAQVIAFCVHAAVQLMSMKEDEVEELLPHINKLSKQIIKECKDLRLDKSSYKQCYKHRKAWKPCQDRLIVHVISVNYYGIM